MDPNGNPVFMITLDRACVFRHRPLPRDAGPLRSIRLLIAAVLLCAGTQPVAASFEQETLLDIYGDADTVSIAAGIRQPVATAPAVATVITAEMIAAMGASDLDELLEAVPGLHVSHSHIGYNPLYIFRGINSRYNPQVLVLINGIPITNLHLGDRGNSWGGMPVEAIARIEVIRGPGSALYGADAIAGVINIITKSGRDITRGHVSVGAGSYRTGNAALQSAWQMSGWDMGLVLEYHQTDGHDGIIEWDAQSHLDATFATDASHAPGSVNLSRRNVDVRFDMQWAETWRLRAGYQGRRDWGIGAGVAEALDPYGRYASDKFNLDLSWRKPLLNDTLQLETTLSYFDTTHEVEKDLIIFPPGVDLGEGEYPQGYIGNPEVFERHYRAGFAAQFLAIQHHNLSLGGGYYRGDLHKVKESKNFGIHPQTGLSIAPGSALVDVTDTDYVFLREDVRENTFIYLQDIWRIANDWELTAGVRYDHYSDFGGTTNPRLALVWQTSYNLTTKFLYGQAFRAPSFAETRAINNPVVLGNPALKPESLHNYEIAFDYRATEKITLLLNIYHYLWRDIIEFVPDPDQNSNTAQNLGRQEGNGFEFEISWKSLPTLCLSLNLSSVNLTAAQSRGDGLMAPERQLFGKVQWKPQPNWLVYWQANYVGGRNRSWEDQRSDIDDYVVMDMNLMYTGTRLPWSASLKIGNLLDEDAREPSWWTYSTANIPGDLPLAGRHFLVKFGLDF